MQDWDGMVTCVVIKLSLAKTLRTDPFKNELILKRKPGISFLMSCSNRVCNSSLKIYAIYMHIGDLILLFVLQLEMCKLKKRALKSLSQDQVLTKSSAKSLLTCKLHKLVEVLDRKYWISKFPGDDDQYDFQVLGGLVRMLFR